MAGRGGQHSRRCNRSWDRAGRASIKALRAGQLENLSRRQATAIIQTRPKALSRTQVRSLDFVGVAPEKLSDLSRKVLRKISAAQINDLTVHKFKAVIK